MTIAFVGYEGKGTWQVRAKQLAPIIDASLDPNLTNPSRYKGVIIIKMPEPHLLDRIRKFNLSIIWDPQDCWPQTDKLNMSNDDRPTMLKWLDYNLKWIQPQIVIATTTKMQEDCKELGFESIVIHHHHRPNIQINPIRQQLNIVGIEGTPKQLGEWPKRIKRICKNLGLTFQSNLDSHTDSLHSFDVVITMREHTGYAAKNWKSNVKLANAHGSGTPGIFSREQGYLDTASGYELWADDEIEIVEHIEQLKSYQYRKTISENFINNSLSIEKIAEEYKSFINKILK